MIYHEVFRDVVVLPFQLLGEEPENDLDRHTGFTLFLVNKEMYGECRPVFWKEVIFSFEVSRGFEGTPTMSFQPMVMKSKMKRMAAVHYMEKMSCSDMEFVYHALNAKMSVSVDTASSPPPIPLKEIYFNKYATYRMSIITFFGTMYQDWRHPVEGLFEELKSILPQLGSTRVYCKTRFRAPSIVCLFVFLLSSLD